MTMTIRSNVAAQRGVSLSGLIVILIIISMVAVVAMKVVPTFTEFLTVKKAITTAKNAGGSPAEIRLSFDKQQDAGYFDAVASKDLLITTNPSGGFDVGFEYQKK